MINALLKLHSLLLFLFWLLELFHVAVRDLLLFHVFIESDELVGYFAVVFEQLHAFGYVSISLDYFLGVSKSAMLAFASLWVCEALIMDLDRL